MSPYHRELHKICRIEKHVGILLIRVDPLNFGPAYVRPMHYGLTCRERALVEVADNASEETVVTGRNAVVVIQ